MRPSSHVIEQFGATGDPRALSGERGSVWRAGDIVLKPLDMLPDELGWLHAQMPLLQDDDELRVSLPIVSRAGALFVDGWTAFPWLMGSHESGRWSETAVIASRFTDRLARNERPAFLDDRDHAWANADRYAWDEIADPYLARVPLVASLSGARREVDDSPAIIHADLTGNVLFDHDVPPAVIDPTIYWRPVRYAVAIIAVDAVCFENAPLTLLETIDPSHGFRQHLLRALLFRIVTDLLNGVDESVLGAYRLASSRVLKMAP